MNKYGILISVFIISLAGISSWLKTQILPGTSDENPSVGKTAYYLKNFKIHDMNENGLLRFELIGQLLHYSPEKDSVEILKPRLSFKEPNTAPWQIIADKALTLESLDEINFLGDVKMMRPASAIQATLNIDTQNLLLKPQAETAETQQKTIITSANSVLVATGGLIANIKNNAITLHQVEGRYAANH